MKLHQQCCPSANNQDSPLVNLSLDGVQESKSSNCSIDIYCINIKPCRNIYPLRLIRPNERYKYDEQEELANVVADINSSGMIIDTGVGDNPKRSTFKMAKTCAATHGCEYCEAPSLFYKDNTMTRGHLTWPPSTMNGRPRTITGIRRIVNQIEEEGYSNLSKDYVKGIKDRSVFLNQNNFDLILDLPSEYMHSVCLGNGKKLLECTYKLGKDKHRVTKRKRCDPKVFNDLIASVQVFHEFSRRCRNLDTAVYKAQEYRNVILFFFVIVLENIPEEHKKERQLWLTMAFMIRSCILPNEEFRHVSQASIVNACELYYNLYHELFGQRNCAYSIHVVSSHLLKMKGNAPLTEKSAFRFESFYSEMKNLFNAGTRAPLKQILQNTFMKRALEFHACEKKLSIPQNQKNKHLKTTILFTHLKTTNMNCTSSNLLIMMNFYARGKENFPSSHHYFQIMTGKLLEYSGKDQLAQKHLSFVETK